MLEFACMAAALGEGSEYGGLLHGLCLLEWQPADRPRSKLHDPPPAHQRIYLNMVDHT